MEAIIAILLSLVAKTVVGRYVTKLLEKIDAGLAQMFADKKSPKEISTYIEKNNLQEEFGGFANEFFKGSVIVPSMSSGTPTPETKAEFFSLILGMGFFLSNHWQTDLILPGSFLGENTLSIFGGNRRFVPEIYRDKVKITWESKDVSFFQIISLSDETIKSYFEDYKIALYQYKNEHSDYSSLRKLVPIIATISEKCAVKGITAGSVIFSYSNLMPPDQINALGIENGRAKIDSWESGLDKMLESIPKIVQTFVLPEKEIDAIKKFTEKLKNI